MEANKINREIRVFISSTFHDMHEEREILTKYIFPRLRNKYAGLNLLIQEIDLRWGIPEEEEASILGACLHEIEQSDYMIIMLGNRYGTEIHSYSESLLARYPWLSHFPQASVTELEVRCALKSQAISNEAISCYSKKGAARLDTLKTDIEENGIQIWNGYSHARELGEFVYIDLCEFIDSRFSEELESKRSPALDQKEFVYARQAVQNQLNELLKQNHRSIVLWGEEGTGKTVFLKDWTATQNYISNSTAVFLFDCATGDINTIGDLLSRVMSSINNAYSLSFNVPFKEYQRKSAFADWLIAVKDTVTPHLVIVIDGIEEIIEDPQYDLNWIQESAPEHLTFIVSTNSQTIFELVSAKDYIPLEVPGLTTKEKQDFIHDYLASFGKRLSSQLVDKICTSSLSELPAFMKGLLNELRLHGSYETLVNLLETLLRTQALEEFYEGYVRRLLHDYETDQELVSKTFKLIACSKNGLTEEEVHSLLKWEGISVTDQLWIPFYESITSFLSFRKDSFWRKEMFSFSFTPFKEVIWEFFLSNKREQKETHQLLGEFFEYQNEYSIRQKEEQPWQLIQAREWTLLYTLLSRPGFMMDCMDTDQSNFYSYWKVLEENSLYTAEDAYDRILEHPGQLQDALRPLSIFYRAHGLMDKAETAMRLIDVGDLSQEEHVKVLIDTAGNYSVQNRHRELIDTLTKAEKIARKIGNDDLLQRALVNQVKSLTLFNQIELAWEKLKEAETIATRLDHDYVMSGVLDQKVMLLMHRGSYAQAEELLEKKEALCREQHDNLGLSSCKYKKGKLFYLLGRGKQALTELQEAERLARETGDNQLLANSLSAQADILYDHGNTSQAIELLHTAEEIYRNREDYWNLQSVLNTFSTILGFLERYDEAIEVLREAEEINTNLEALNNLQITYGNFGILYRKQGFLEEALRYYKQKEEICRDIQNIPSLALCLGYQGNLHLDLGDYEKALSKHSEKLNLVRQSKSLKSIANALGGKAGALTGLNRIEEALECLTEQESIAREINNVNELFSSLIQQIKILKQIPFLRLELHEKRKEAIEIIERTGRFREALNWI